MQQIRNIPAVPILKWLSAALLLGAAGGLAAILLQKSIGSIQGFTSQLPLWLAPIIGSLLASLIFRYDALARGFGANHYIHSVTFRRGEMRESTLFTKFAATALTIGFWGSGGLQGPLLVIGGNIANILTRHGVLKQLFHPDHLRLLSICGAAGAIGANLRAPFGGGLFVVEILYHSSLRLSTLVTAVVSSCAGYAVYHLAVSPDPVLNLPNYAPALRDIPWIAAASLAAGVVSYVFICVFNAIRWSFQHVRSSMLCPVLGGAMAGTVFVVAPQAAGGGVDFIQSLFVELPSFSLAAAVIAAKILATSFTVGSGGSGGLVMPAVFVGAVVGTVTASLVGFETAASAVFLVIAAIAASLASTIHIPLATAVILIEMGGWGAVFPAVVGSTIGFFLTKGKNIYGIIQLPY